MISQKQVDTNIARIKSKRHVNKRRLAYWTKQKEKYTVIAWKRDV